MKTLKIADSENVLLLDDYDYDRLCMYNWRMTTNGYVRTTINGVRGFIHHFVLGKPPVGLVTDHVDRNKLNNQRINLRFISVKNNGLNSKRTDNPRWGIYWNGREYRVRIKRNGELTHIGTYPTVEQAQVARDSFVAVERLAIGL